LVGFSRTDAKRVASATVTVERMKKNTPKRGGLTRPVPSGFFAKITGKSGHKYSWVCMKVNDSHELEEETDFTGSYSDEENYAVEIHKSEYVLTNSIVWLEGARTENCFIFNYHPGIVHGLVYGSEITAREGMTVGSGEVTVRLIDEYGNDVADGETVSVKNYYLTEIEEDKPVAISFGDGGYWWILSEDCQEEEEEE